MQRLIFLHGNLQVARVWDPIVTPLKVDRWCVDLWSQLCHPVGQWTQQFLQQVNDAEGKSAKNILVGYSMGGRLAMQLLAAAQDLWAGAVLIGAHPGSEDPNQRKAWLERDDAWASRFESDEPWESLVGEWDALPVFCGVPNPCPPRETDFDRKRLAQVQRDCSKGRQEYLLPKLQSIRQPILYVSGELDTVYTDLGARITKSLPNCRQAVVKNTGHRVPWEQPEAFQHILRDFVESLPRA